MNFSHFHKLHHHQKNPFDGNVASPIWPMEKFARLSNVRHWFPRSQKLFNWRLSEQKRFGKFEHQQPVWLTWKKIKNNQSKRAERESLLETNPIIRPVFKFYETQNLKILTIWMKKKLKTIKASNCNSTRMPISVTNFSYQSSNYSGTSWKRNFESAQVQAIGRTEIENYFHL